jgi:hypothetical protein
MGVMTGGSHLSAREREKEGTGSGLKIMGRGLVSSLGRIVSLESKTFLFGLLHFSFFLFFLDLYLSFENALSFRFE